MKISRNRRELLAETITIRLSERLKSKVGELKDSGVNCQEWLRKLIEKELEAIKTDPSKIN